MKKHIGDRRGRARFEIVGRLTGSLETLERWAVRNIGEGGALIETPAPLAPGGKVGGRLSFRGQMREVRGEVRHIATAAARDGGMRYFVGVQWDASVEVADFVNMMPIRPAQTRSVGTDRRAAARVIPGPEAEIGQARWSTVDVIDISTTGVLLAAHQALDLGERGELRVRLGDHSFAAQIEVRRTDARKSSSGMNHGIGAAFVSLDDGKRVQLEDFIGDVRR